jgi:hypothetical protein
MNRRGFLGLLSGATAAVTVGAQAATGPVETQKFTHPVAAVPGRYSIGGSELSVEWNWQHDGWRMSSRDGGQWFDDGPLDKAGRALILEHFGLEDLSQQLSLEVVAALSPARLFALRRQHEARWGLDRKNDMISDRGGGHCSAEHCA